jgi:hypothetical protein
MSRFIDKLKRMRQTEPRQIGFMAAQAPPEKLMMQLVVRVLADDIEKNAPALSSADAVLIEIAKSDDIDALAKTCRAKDSIPAGGWLKAASTATMKKLMNSDCDLVVFPASVPFSVIPKEKVGRILELDSSLSDSLLRTVSDLPVDAVLIPCQEDKNPLTCSSLMLVQRLMYLVNKPVFVPVSVDIAAADLQALWDIGVSGVVVDSAAEKLSELRKILGKLEPPAYRKKSRVSVTLPRLQPETPAPQSEEEEEDE